MRFFSLFGSPVESRVNSVSEAGRKGRGLRVAGRGSAATPGELVEVLEARLVLAAPTMTHVDPLGLTETGGMVTLTYDALAAAADEADADGDTLSFRLFGITGQFFRGGVSAGPTVMLDPTGPTSTIDIKIDPAVFPAIAAVAFDGSSSSTPPVLLSLTNPNQPPVSTAPTPREIGLSDPRVAVGLTFETVTAALGISDPEGDHFAFKITADPYGVIPASLQPDPNQFTPVIMGSSTFFTGAVPNINMVTAGIPLGVVDLLPGVLIDDRGAESAPVMLRVRATNRPVIGNPALPAFGPVEAESYFTIRYEDLVSIANIRFDAGEDLTLVVTSLAPQPGSAGAGVSVSELRKNGTPMLGQFTLGPNESVEWYQAPGDIEVEETARAILAFQARTGEDLSLTSVGSARAKIRVLPLDADERGPFHTTPGHSVHIAADPFPQGELDVFMRNDVGHFITFFQQTPDDAWARIDLTADVGLPVITSDPVAWDDPKDSQRYGYGAALTADGLILLKIDVLSTTEAGVFTFRNLNNDIPGSPKLTGELTTFIGTDGLVHIVGRDANGDVILFRQTGRGVQGSYEWDAQNLSAELRDTGQEAPELEGRMIAYVTAWNGLNIAGLNEDGEIWSIWTAPGLGGWQSANLSAITGAPTLKGGLSAYLTSWGGINIAGIDQSDHLTVTWWVPGFEGEWRNSDFTVLFGGVAFRPQTVSSYVTPWGGLNIAGIDSNGDLRIYWWEPSRAGDPELDVWTDSTIRDAGAPSSNGAGAFAITSPINAVVTVDQRINLVGTNADGDVVRVWWKPDFGGDWQSEVL